MVGTSPTVPGKDRRAAPNSLRVMIVRIHETPNCLTRKSVLNLRSKPRTPHASLEKKTVFAARGVENGENNGLRVYQLEGCDLLPAHQEIHDIHRQGTNAVLLLEGSQGWHARYGARRLQGGRDEDRSARP